MSVKTIVVEDEKRSRKSLINLLSRYCPNIEVMGEAEDVLEAISKINTLRPNLIFLDIQLKTGTAFDILKAIEFDTLEIIFTTAFDEYALDAFRFSAISYLLKPIDVEELIKSVDRASKMINNIDRDGRIQNFLDNLKGTDLKINVHTEESIEFIAIKDIVYFKADGPYCNLYLSNGDHLITSRPLKDFEQILSKHHFLRVHHSYMINTKEVKRFNRNDGGAVVLKTGQEIPVARRRREEFFNRLGGLELG